MHSEVAAFEIHDNRFGEGPAGFAGADPGQYEYLCESTYAEYYFDLRPNSTTEIMISGAKIEDTVTVLDLLETALAERRQAAPRALTGAGR